MDDSMSKRELVSRLMGDALLAPAEVEVGQTVELDGGRKVLITDIAHDEVRGVELDPEYRTVTGVSDSVCEADLNNLRDAFCAPPQDSTEITVGRLDGEPLSEFARPAPYSTTPQPYQLPDEIEEIIVTKGCATGKTNEIELVKGESPFVSDTPIKPLSADEILAADPETAQDIIDWQDATYLLLGAMMLSQGKLAARISVAQLEKFRQKYELQFTKGADGSLNYKVRQKPKNSGAKNV